MADQELSDLRTSLRRLHREAGEPSTRDIGKAINYSHTTVAQLLNGSRCPVWTTLQALVIHLGGDSVEFKRLWIAARDAEDLRLVGKDETTTTEVEEQTVRRDSTERLRRTVLRLTRTTSRDGTRSEEMEIFDQQLAREWIKSYLQENSDASETHDD
ncbi:MAG: hypothetical protein ACRDS9_16525 [Pseudonocardiaceae bacterium]